MDDETRAYLDRALGGFRQDMEGLRQEVGGLRQEVGGLRQEVGGVHQEVGGLRQEIHATAAETRRHFDVVAEDLRHDIRAIAEGVAATSERVDRLGGDLRSEMDQRFAATHAVVRVAFNEVRRDIGELRARL